MVLGLLLNETAADFVVHTCYSMHYYYYYFIVASTLVQATVGGGIIATAVSFGQSGSTSATFL